MLRLLFLAASCVLWTAAIDDFVASDHSYEFYYHDLQDLLLVVHNDNCYYAYIEDDYDQESRYLIRYRASTERYLERVIYNHSHDRIQTSSLDAMRARFHDLLADFHCLDKHVYSLSLRLEDVQWIIDHHYNNGGHNSHHGN